MAAKTPEINPALTATAGKRRQDLTPKSLWLPAWTATRHWRMRGSAAAAWLPC